MKRIFVSQSERDMGRNRQHRRLEARLDSIKLNIPKMPEVTLCPHIKYCYIVTQKRCLFSGIHKECNVAKFYNKNPNYRNK